MMCLVNHVSRDGLLTLSEESLVYAEMPDANVNLLARLLPEIFHGQDDLESLRLGLGLGFTLTLSKLLTSKYVISYINY
jgi:hypothetical protein